SLPELCDPARPVGIEPVVHWSVTATGSVLPGTIEPPSLNSSGPAITSRGARRRRPRSSSVAVHGGEAAIRVIFDRVERYSNRVAMSITGRSRGMGPPNGLLAREPRSYPRVDGLRQRDVRRFEVGGVAAKRRVGRPAVESRRTSNVVRSVVRARRLRVL